MMLCPRCGQGEVGLYEVVATGERFLICDECEAAWLPSAEPDRKDFLQLFEIFDERGLPESWDGLRVAR